MEEQINCDTLKLNTPGTFLVSGSTMAGKSTWVRNLILHKDTVLRSPTSHTHYCYSEWQEELFSAMQEESGVIFHQGLPTVEDLRKWRDEACGSHFILVMDDLMMEATKSAQVQKIFTIYSHHFKMSVIVLVHNLFPKEKFARDISLNCTYIVIFRSKRDKMQLTHLARQVFPGQTSYFLSAYDDAVNNRQYKYLLLDLHPSSGTEFMLRTNIFPTDEEGMWIYRPPL